MFFLLLLLASILVFGLFQTKIKGLVGEKTVAIILSLLDKSKYIVVNNVVLNTQGRTSQIDHIVISDFGVFVIETKNYKGWILGGEHNEYWTQVLYERKEKLYNPIRQNFGHILSLKNCLYEFPNVKYISIVVFSSKANVKVKTNTAVTTPFKLLKVIRGHSEASLSGNDKERILEKIGTINVKDKYNKRQHIKSIKQKINERENLKAQNKCPYCAKDLILRQGKFGKFLGCSNYPKCKFTKNV